MNLKNLYLNLYESETFSSINLYVISFINRNMKAIGKKLFLTLLLEAVGDRCR